MSYVTEKRIFFHYQTVAQINFYYYQQFIILKTLDGFRIPTIPLTYFFFNVLFFYQSSQ